ncbi:MAG: SLBB domain-containing protein [Anaeromyxobacteraceae bacterium]
MQRSATPFRRALALFLACQPVLWMSNVAYAQSLGQGYEMQRPDPRSQDGQAAGAASQQASPQQLQLLQQQMGGQGAFGSTQPPTSGQPGGSGLLGTPSFGVPGAASEGEGLRVDQPRIPQASTTSPPVDEPIDPARYVLGPNDILELHFWGVENFRVRVTVDLEGRGFVPKIGYLPLGGKTLAEAQNMLRDSVARYFPKLGFGVNLVEPRTFLVQVVDDVARPGSYPARAIERVATLIQRAGGFGPNASRRRIEVRRRDGTVITADLLLYAITGDVKHNPYVLDGDAIRVPFQSLVASIGGAVNRPGRYELVGTNDLAELVELAGGLTPGATTGLPVQVVRRAPEEKLVRLSFDFSTEGKLPLVPIVREDSVWIPAFLELQQSVTITGALAGVAPTAGVAGTTTALATGGANANSATSAMNDDGGATRRLPFAQGDTVRSMLERVGGVGPLADLKGSYILRNNQAIPVDLYALVMMRDLRADKPVELGDTIVIPFKRPNVLVEGAVFKPGPYPYNPNFNVEQYLALAGGPNRFAQSTDNVYMVTPEGQTREFAPDLKVEPGASLVVPERNFSRSEVVAIILAGAGLLLSGVTIWLTLRK